MTMYLISSFALSLLFLMPLMAQPLSLGLCIMVLTTTFSIMLGMFYSSWYAYILFLVFVGGLLVMFAYVSVLVPNTLFSSMKTMTWMLTIFLTSNLILTISTLNSTQKMSTLSQAYSPFKSSVSSGLDLVPITSTSVIIILGAILLFALLAVVKICYYQQSSLRPYSNL